MHRTLLVIAIGLLALMLSVGAASCGGDEEGDGEGPAPPSGDRIEGGSLTVATVEVDSLDPHYSSFSQDISLARMIWRGLYTLDIDNEPQPTMAEELPEVSEDGKTYTVKVREGLQWSDGDDLLAEDFVMGVHRTCNPVHAGEYQYLLSNIVGCDEHYTNEAGYDASLEEAIGVEAVDDLTLEFTLNEAQPTFTIMLSLWMTFPAPVHLLPESSDLWPEPAPAAPGELAYNGPYVLAEYVAGDHATLEPNPNWIGDVKPTLDSLVLRFIDDFAVADNAYRAGEVDFANGDETQLAAIVSEFGESGVGEYLKVEVPITVGLQMQLEKPPLDDLDVRMALGRAFDREQLNQVVYSGGHTPTTSWIPLSDGGDEPDAFEDVIGFDVEAAQQHLADAGYPDGDGFPVLTILVRDDPSYRGVAEFLQESFRTNLNIETEIEVVDSPTRSARYTAEDFELFPGGWQHDYPDPENWILGQYDTDGSLNNVNCSLPEIDELVEAARFNTDNEERLQQYKDINRLIAENVCGISPYLHFANHYLIKPFIVGMTEYATGQDAAIAGDWIAEAWGRSE